MNDTGQRIAALLQTWFTRMAIRHCGRDYGSERRNAYFFYRKVYQMSALETWETIARWHIGESP